MFFFSHPYDLSITQILYTPGWIILNGRAKISRCKNKKSSNMHSKTKFFSLFALLVSQLHFVILQNFD